MCCFLSTGLCYCRGFLVSIVRNLKKLSRVQTSRLFSVNVNRNTKISVNDKCLKGKVSLLTISGSWKLFSYLVFCSFLEVFRLILKVICRCEWKRRKRPYHISGVCPQKMEILLVMQCTMQNFLDSWGVIQPCEKFCVFCTKICGETICQSWPLLTKFFNFCIVQWLNTQPPRYFPTLVQDVPQVLQVPQVADFQPMLHCLGLLTITRVFYGM